MRAGVNGLAMAARRSTPAPYSSLRSPEPFPCYANFALNRSLVGAVDSVSTDEPIGKSFRRPVTNAIVSRCTAFRICNQLIYSSPNTCQEIRAKIWLPSIVPFSSVKHIRIKERMVT